MLDSKRTLLKGYIPPFQDSETASILSAYGYSKDLYIQKLLFHGQRSYIRALTEKCTLQIVDHLGPYLRSAKLRNWLCHPPPNLWRSLYSDSVCWCKVLFPELSWVVTPARSNEDTDFSKVTA